MRPVLFGDYRLAGKRPDAIVIDHGNRAVFGLGSRLLRRRFGVVRFRFIVALLVNQGSVVAWDDLEEFVVGDCPDGGPLELRNNLRVYRYSLRYDLPADMVIETVFSWGLRLVQAGAERRAA